MPSSAAACPASHAVGNDSPTINLFVGDGSAKLPKNRHRLRLGVNLFPLALRGGGMRQYVLQLLPLLVRRTDHEFVIFHGLTALPSIGGTLRGLSDAERARVRLVEVEHSHEIYAHTKSFDVYFCPLNGFEPQLLDRPTLATLADVQERFFPQYFSPGELAARSIVYPRVIHSVTTLVTISEFSKETICSEFGADPGRIRVTHLAPNYGMLNAASEWPTSLPQLPDRFVVYPANTYPHKNHALLLQAVARLKSEGRLTFKCVLTGHRVGHSIELDRLIEKHGLAADVVWMGHVPPGALRYLYERALLLCFPSEFEGFGMPLVEAMYCGCPVVANRAASIPEICGDAALYVDPTPALWAESISRLVDDDEARADLIAKGRRQAERFTVERLADETIGLIDDAVDRFHDEGGPDQPTAFVVLGCGCNRSLERSLKQLALIVDESDQILVIEDAGELDERVVALIDNFEQVCVKPRNSDWTTALTAEMVFVMSAGAAVCEGAPRAAAAALAANPESQMAIGEVLYCDPHGQYLGLSYTRFHEEATPPLEAVAWRRDSLRPHVEALTKPNPIKAAMRVLPDRAAVNVSRTFSTRIVWPVHGQLAHLPRRPLARRILGRLRREVKSRLRRFV
ncbi:MAG: glycosyltransferase family 1 protein [Planctomycetaceae bacterium]